MDGSRMPQRLPPCSCLVAFVAVFLSALPLFGDAIRPSNWKFDLLRLKSGRTLQGLIVAKTAAGVRFQIVRQNAGQHTFLFNPTTFPHDEIASVVPLQPAEREELAARLKKLD